MRGRGLVGVAVVTAGALLGTIGAAVTRAQVGFNATPVLQTMTTVTGQAIQFPGSRNEITALLLELAPGGETGRHQHPAPTFVYVLEGTLTVEGDGHPARTYAAGQAFVESISAWHNGLNRGAAPVKALVVFAGEQGKANLVRP